MNYLIVIKNDDEIIPTYQQTYIKNNKEYIQEQRQKYYQNNKEKFTEYNKVYQSKNRHKINEKFTCVCGGKFTRAHKSRHLLSKIHLNYLYSITL
jgi:hypothetical protein